MSKEESVLKYYLICNKLKNIVRSGWKRWRVNKDRLESIAEHVYGVQMLAIAMYSEYQYDLNIFKVIFMLAIHELEETVIGDMTPFDSGYNGKEEKGHKAVEEILKPLLKGEKIKELIYEFDKRESIEAKFAYHCDKLEADLQCKLYDEDEAVSFDDLDGLYPPFRKLVEDSKGKSWADIFLNYDKSKYADDSNFMKVLEYAINNHLTDTIKR